MYPAARLRADLNGLGDGFEQQVAFVTHMRGVEAAAVGRRTGKFDDLLGGCPLARRVDQPGGQAARTLFHGPLHVTAHDGDLGGRR